MYIRSSTFHVISHMHRIYLWLVICYRWVEKIWEKNYRRHKNTDGAKEVDMGQGSGMKWKNGKQWLARKMELISFGLLKRHRSLDYSRSLKRREHENPTREEKHNTGSINLVQISQWRKGLKEQEDNQLCTSYHKLQLS